MIYAELFVVTILGMAGCLGYAWWTHLDYRVATLVRDPFAHWVSFVDQLGLSSLANMGNVLSEWPLLSVVFVAAILEGLTQRRRYPWTGYGRRLWRLSQMLLSVVLLGLGMSVMWPSPVNPVWVQCLAVSLGAVVWGLTFSYPRTG